MYVWAKILHLLGAMLFIGNIVTAGYWKLRADRSGDVRLIHTTIGNVMRCDYYFTIPGLALLLGTGFWMASMAGFSVWSVFWTRTAIMLLAVTGVLWLAILLPCQITMMREAQAALDQAKPSRAYWRATARWNGFGLMATLVPLGILYLMVARPL